MPKIKGGARTGNPAGTIKYISKESDREMGTHGLISDERDTKGIVQEFNENLSGRGKRAYYHDHVSFHPKDNPKCTPKFMQEFSERYIEKNYDNQQVFWGVHREKKHVHVHFCISATDMDGKKIQLSNAFMRNRDEMVQAFSKERGLHHMEPKMRYKRQDHTLDIAKKESGIESKKELYREKIQRVIDDPNVDSKEAFKKALEKEGISLSKRETGIDIEGRTYRFNKLGFDKKLYKEENFINYRKKDVLDRGITDKKQSIDDYLKDLKITKNKGIDKGMNRGVER